MRDRFQDVRQRYPIRDREQERRPDRERPERERVDLTESQRGLLRDVTKFRVVRDTDLAEFRYDGDLYAMRADAKELERQGLVKHTRVDVLNGQRPTFVTLRNDASDDLHRDDVTHDAGLYRLYQMNAEELRAEGNRPVRIVFERELESKAYSDLRHSKESWSARLKSNKEIVKEVAERNGLHVSEEGALLFPDMRVIYETPEGDMARVDLELTTEHYRAAQIQAKVNAGMRVYGLHTATWGVTETPRIAERTFSR